MRQTFNITASASNVQDAILAAHPDWKVRVYDNGTQVWVEDAPADVASIVAGLPAFIASKQVSAEQAKIAAAKELSQADTVEGKYRAAFVKAVAEVTGIDAATLTAKIEAHLEAKG